MHAGSEGKKLFYQPLHYRKHTVGRNSFDVYNYRNLIVFSYVRLPCKVHVHVYRWQIE